jgi:hypothetical protein
MVMFAAFVGIVALTYALGVALHWAFGRLRVTALAEGVARLVLAVARVALIIVVMRGLEAKSYP